jgi:DNA-binding LacI/PurR family transcriptional regulator
MGDAPGTLKLVAKLAGVAPSTVSRVLNISGSVAPETRDKVLPKKIGQREYKRLERPDGLLQQACERRMCLLRIRSDIPVQP